MATQRDAFRRDWLSKILAGVLLGFLLALGCSGMFVALTPGIQASARAQLAMWLVIPVWLGVLGGCFFFRSGTRAWLWLGSANALAFGVLAAMRMS